MVAIVVAFVLGLNVGVIGAVLLLSLIRANGDDGDD